MYHDITNIISEFCLLYHAKLTGEREAWDGLEEGLGGGLTLPGVFSGEDKDYTSLGLRSS